MMFCAIWYHLYNFENTKNAHGGVLLLVKLQALACIFTKSKDLWVFLIVQMVVNRTKRFICTSSCSYSVRNN